MRKILYVASSYNHIKSFHLPYIEELRKNNEVEVMSNTNEGEIKVNFVKKYLSFTNFINLFKIRKIINKNKYDCIILNTSLASFLVRLSLKGKKNRPLVINIVHGYLFSSLHGFKNKILFSMEKIVKNQTDYILTMNDFDYEIAKEKSLAKRGIYKICGMGVKRSNTFENPSPYEQNRYNILYAAELSNRKNQLFILNHLKRIIEIIPNVKVNFIGQGSNYRKYVKFVQDNNLHDYVKFWGFVNEPANFFKHCDLYVSSSEIEGLPFNILNAVEYDKNIICSNIKGHKDIDEIDNYLYLYNDGNEFLNLIKTIYRSKKTKKGEKTFLHFEFNNVFNENITLIQSLINRN
ncbi:MAG: glycosyltransferase [Bacilli bacterium]|nr:glycosyltransferase [Bacilli bacterium]